jgi:glyceraldehyde 3-phosphate dehydrogenase
LTDLVAIVREPATGDSINAAYEEAAGAALSGLLEFADEPLVSSDIVGSTASCVFDPGLTMVSGQLVKVLGWYDNETGYSSRLIDLAALVGAAT